MIPRTILSFIFLNAAASPVLPQQYNQLTDVPTIYIETENGSNITSKEQYIKCRLVYVDGDSVATYPDTEIRGRGNSTWWNADQKNSL